MKLIPLDAAKHAQVHEALEVLRALREDLLSGRVVAFAAVGIAKDDTTYMYTSSTQSVSRLRVIGAIAHLGHSYSNGD